MSGLESVIEIVAPVLRAMVDHPDELFVSFENGTLHVEAHPSDRPKLIGMGGRNARALRLILGAIGRARGENYSLDISDQEPF